MISSLTMISLLKFSASSVSENFGRSFVAASSIGDSTFGKNASVS